MSSRPTFSDVVHACGVSLATVSKALNPHADRRDVARKTQERVLAAARKLGYQRDTVESAKRRKRSGNLGLMWARHAPQVDSVYEFLIENAAELGQHILFTPISDAGAWRDMQMLQRLDGVISEQSSAAPADSCRCTALRAVGHLQILGHRRVLYLRIGIDWHYCDREKLPSTVLLHQIFK